MRYQIMITNQAEEDLERIVSQVLRDQIARQIDRLADDPEAGHQPRYLYGLYSLQASFAHHRIIYRLNRKAETVYVLAINPGYDNEFGVFKPTAMPRVLYEPPVKKRPKKRRR